MTEPQNCITERMPNSIAETATDAVGGLITGALRTAWHGAKQVVMQGAAWSLIVAGLIVPFVPVPVAVVGGYMLARNSAATRRFLAKQRTRWPSAFDRTIDFTAKYSPRLSEDVDRLTGIEHLTRQRGSGPEQLAEAVLSPVADLTLSIEGRRINFSAFKPRNYLPRQGRVEQAEPEMRHRPGDVPEDLVRRVVRAPDSPAKSRVPPRRPIASHPRDHIRHGMNVNDPMEWRPPQRGPRDGDKLVEEIRRRRRNP